MNRLEKILSGDILVKNKYLKGNVKFLAIIFFLLFVYILFNGLAAMKLSEAQKIRNEINELKQESVYYSAELMNISLQSNVYEQIIERKIGLTLQAEPPKKIILKEKK